MKLGTEAQRRRDDALKAFVESIDAAQEILVDAIDRARSVAGLDVTTMRHLREAGQSILVVRRRLDNPEVNREQGTMGDLLTDRMRTAAAAVERTLYIGNHDE